MICLTCSHEIDDESAFCPYCGRRIDGSPDYSEYEYAAFISYRHLPIDRTVAVKLQRALENYTVPKALRRQGVQKKLGKLFRDEDELPTSSSLPDQIRDALKRSPFLIVICSPQTNESLWVKREVELFASFHGRERVRIALAEGEPDESFPELLRTRLSIGEDGALTKVEEEPLAADFRDLSRKKFNTEKLRIAAPLIGCGFDDLRQRVKARRQRIVLGASSGIVAISLAFGSFSLYQQLLIQENYRRVQISESEFLADEAFDLLEAGDRYQAVQVALAALPKGSSSNDRPFVPAAQMALESALQIYPSENIWDINYSKYGLNSSGSACSETGLIAAADESGCIIVTDVNSEEIARIDARIMAAGYSLRSSKRFQLAFANESLICISDSLVACFDARTGSKHWLEHLERISASSGFAVSADGSRVAIVDDSSWSDSPKVYSIDIGSGETSEYAINAFAKREDSSGLGSPYLAFAEDGQTIVSSIGGQLLPIDKSGKVGSLINLKLPDSGPISYIDGKYYAISRITDGDDVCIQSFDADMNEVWSYSDKVHAGFNRDGVSYSETLKICGLYEKDGSAKPLLIAILKSSLVAIDIETGDVVYRLVKDSPFLDCVIRTGTDGDTVEAITGDGEFLMRWPDENQGANDYASIFDTNLGEASAASFLSKNNELYLTMWSDNPAKYCVYGFGGRGYLLDEEYLFGRIDKGASFRWDNEHRAALYDREAVILNPITLEKSVSVAYGDLDGLDQSSKPRICFSDDSDAFYLYGEEVDRSGSKTGNTVIYKIDGRNGSIVANYRLEGMTLTQSGNGGLQEARDANNNKLIIARDLSNILIIDADKGNEVQRIEGESRVGGINLLGNTLLVHFDPLWSSDREGLATYDLGSGNEIEFDYLKFKPNGNNSNCVACSRNAGHIAIACSDGIVRMFDVSTGRLKWESSYISTGAQYLFYDSITGNVLLQDDGGHCILISGENGEIIKTTSSAIPGLSSCSLLGENGLVACYYQKPGLAMAKGLIIFSLDKDSFGPLSKINEGLFTNVDGTLVAIWDAYRNQAVIAHRLPLEQLIEIGNAFENVHPLTDAERCLYRADYE